MANACKIVETSVEYASIAEAIAALTEGQTIQMISDYAVITDTNFDKTCTLDIAGKKLTARLGTNPGRLNVTGGTFTLKDSVGEGSISVASTETSGNTCLFTLSNDAKMIMESGILNTDSKEVNPSYGWLGAVFVSDKSSFEMTGGTINGGYYALSTNGSLSTGTSIKISGGTLKSDRDYVIYAPDKSGTVEITGGTLVGGAGCVATNGSTLNVTGGDFTCTGTGDTGAFVGGDGTTGIPNAVIAAWGRYATAEIEITNGTFEAQGNANCIQIADWTPTTVEVTGGTFKATGETSEIVGMTEQSTSGSGPATSTVAVSGGSYNKAVAEDYMADGFEMKDDGSGNFSPVEKEDPEDPDIDPDPGPEDPEKPAEPVDLSKKASSFDILLMDNITMPPYNYTNKDWRRKV